MLHDTPAARLVLKAFAVWCLILLCAFINGALRELVLLPQMARPAAFVSSGVLLSACIVGVAFTCIPRVLAIRETMALAVGIFWLGLTLVFEFGFGLFVQHRSWDDMRQAYTFRDGNIWPLVLLVTALAPLAVVRLRGRQAMSRLP